MILLNNFGAIHFRGSPIPYTCFTFCFVLYICFLLCHVSVARFRFNAIFFRCQVRHPNTTCFGSHNKSVCSTIFPSTCFRFKNIFSFSDAPSSQGYPRDSVTRRSALAMLTVLGYLDMGECTCASDADCAGLPGYG